MSEPFDYGERLIWVVSFLENMEAERQISRMTLRSRNSAKDQQALLKAWGAVFNETRADLRHARERGLLLLCWPGTRALDGQEGWPG